MTKYILNSGGLKNNPAKAVKFYNEVIKGLGNKPCILYCFFAEKRENWEEKYKKYTEGLLELIDKDIKPIFELAFPDKFVEQVERCDVINIHGGDDHLVQYWLKKFDLQEIFRDKVVATNSASSNALSKYFWTCDWRQCMDGLGILPIKFIPYYKSDWGKDDPRGSIDWEKAYQEFSEYGEKDLPVYALEEGNYIIFEI